MEENWEVYLDLLKIVNRINPSIPWSEGEKIPWNEPGFSKRMLREHLSQDHDAASRRFEIIDQHVSWINVFLLNGQPSKVLDLGCGPGFYCSRLVKLGHSCTGIDFSPASIEDANERNIDENTGITFLQGDLRTIDFPSDQDLVTFIYCEFNTFKKNDGFAILNKARQALKPGGKLLIELNSIETLRKFGQKKPGWHSNKRGLFSEQPYIYLEESFWNEEMQAATCRMYIIDAATGEVTQMADNHQAYTLEQIRELVLSCGYKTAAVQTGWPIEGLSGENSNLILVAEK